jgi:hypothetical protein
MKTPGKIVRASALTIIGIGCVAVVSATAVGTLLFVGCLLLGSFLLNEIRREEYTR